MTQTALSEPRTSSQSLRVASWNLQSCRRGLAAVARQLRAVQADLVALQEVDRCTARARGADQAARLAAEAGFAHHQFFPALPWGAGEYGLALLSRFPLLEPHREPLPVPSGFEPRVLGGARLALPRGELRVHVTHLTHQVRSGRVRLLQAQRLVAVATAGEGSDDAPSLLLGDFNDLPASPMHQTLCEHFVDVFAAVGAGRGGTRPLGTLLPALRIDYVFASPRLRLEGARVVRTNASDHHLLVAEIAAPATAASRRARAGAA